MPLEIRAILDFLEDSLGDLFIGTSALLFFVGILFMSKFCQWISGIAFFLGAAFLISGFAIRLEGPLEFSRPSAGGLGTILVCVSLTTMASAFIFAFFTIPADWHILRVPERVGNGNWMPHIYDNYLILDSAHSLSWLVVPLTTIGVTLLIMGILLKFRSIS
jgi:hypothetical protein